MSKPIVVIWLKGVNLIQENTQSPCYHVVKPSMQLMFHNIILYINT